MRTHLMYGAVAIGALVPAVVLAGVVPISRNSEIKMQGQIESQDLADSKSSTAFGTFNDQISKSGGTEGGTRGNGSTSQNSTVNTSTPNRITGDGVLSTNAFAAFDPNNTAGPLMVLATSTFALTFEVTGQDEPFALHGFFEGNDAIGATSHVTMYRTSQPDPNNSNGTVVFNTDNALGTIIGGGLDFGSNQSLTPGTYSLFADAGSGSSGSGRGDPFSFGQQAAVHLDFSVGSNAQAIPLPAAVWPGVVALGGILGGLTFRRRHT